MFRSQPHFPSHGSTSHIETSLNVLVAVQSRDEAWKNGERKRERERARRRECNRQRAKERVKFVAYGKSNFSLKLKFPKAKLNRKKKTYTRQHENRIRQYAWRCYRIDEKCRKTKIRENSCIFIRFNDPHHWNECGSPPLFLSLMVTSTERWMDATKANLHLWLAKHQDWSTEVS